MTDEEKYYGVLYIEKISGIPIRVKEDKCGKFYMEGKTRCYVTEKELSDKYVKNCDI